MGLKTIMSTIFYFFALVCIAFPILAIISSMQTGNTSLAIPSALSVICCWPIAIWLVLMGLGYAEKGKKDELQEKLMEQNLEEGTHRIHKIIKETEKEDPLAILKARYAKGEITKKEYNKMKKELE
jgi:uncharacterized membrane protein